MKNHRTKTAGGVEVVGVVMGRAEAVKKGRADVSQWQGLGG